MELTCNSIYDHLPKILKDETVDLSECSFIHPWALVFICLLLVERHSNESKKLILPSHHDSLSYIRRANLEYVLKELGYIEEAKILEEIPMNEKDNLNILELKHSRFRDEFSARLERLVRIFRNFGLNEDETGVVVALIGELGNNVYDHNLGNWPTDVSGSFLMAQNYPFKKCIEFVIGDPGIGFLGSLKSRFPGLKDDLSAIKFGLEGNSGRINEKRGNGLKFVQDWTFSNFSGNICIHSGSGLIKIDGNNENIEELNPPKIL